MRYKNLIFIHGFRGNGLGLRELADEFSWDTKIKTTILQVPPAGGNSLTEYTPDTYADFVVDYVKKNKIKKPVLIGHSMGSIIAAATAEKYPELLADKIVFLAPISKKPAKFFASLTPLSAKLPNKMLTYISTKYLFVPRNRELFKKTLETSEKCGTDYTTREDIWKSAEFSAQHAISDFEFSQRACFISGEHDRLIPREATEILARKLHGASIFIPGTGHLLNYEDAPSTAAAIRYFLDGNLDSAFEGV